jgi:aryl-alcohol dehydrogenase-like predicted oxidoreductase
MRYQLLGNSGLRISEACLGTMTFGESIDWGADRDTAHEIYSTFRDAGGTFIDTADIYTGGESEELLGDFIDGHRSEVVISTKYTDAPLGQKASDPNAAGNHRKHMVEAVEASLQRLGTDYIDLLYVHAWDFLTPIDEVMRALDDLVRQGKVLYVGISDTPAWIISRANAIAELKDWSPFVAMQTEYSLIERTPERDLLPMAKALDVTPLAWSPLASGILTGKYSGDDAKGGRLESAPFKTLTNRNLAIADVVLDVAKATGHAPAQVALAWVRQQGVLPLIGATQPRHVESNLESLTITLDDEHRAALNDASQIDLGFPHEFLEGTRAVTYGGYYDEIDGERCGAPLHWSTPGAPTEK